MEEKYIKFYKTFHKKFKNDKNLIHCFKLLSNCGMSASSDFARITMHDYLTFKLWCRSNDLTFETDYSKRQFINLKLILFLQEQGLGYRKIAQKFNEWGIKTVRGNTWFNTSVFSVVKRYGERQERINNRETVYQTKLSKMQKEFISDS